MGLSALKELIRAFQYEIDDSGRKTLVQIAENFFGHLEAMRAGIMNNLGAPLAARQLILIAKIFFMCNTLKLLPFLVEKGRIETWVNFLVAMLEYEAPAGSELVAQTTDMDKIEQLDQSDFWKLKGICAKISVKLY